MEGTCEIPHITNDAGRNENAYEMEVNETVSQEDQQKQPNSTAAKSSNSMNEKCIKIAFLLVTFLAMTIGMAALIIGLTYQSNVSEKKINEETFQNMEILLNNLTLHYQSVETKHYKHFNNFSESHLANSRQLQILQTSIDTLNKIYLDLSQKLDIRPSPGWYTPWNGYQYKLTTSKTNWNDSRIACQAMGGDLAVHGMMDYNTIKKIGQALIEDTNTWIGLNDISSEGRFVWIDGTNSTSNNTHWNPRQPDDWQSDEDCAEIRKNDEYRLNDIPCSTLRYGLCEKRLV